MKPTMLFAIVMLTVIVIIASFGLQMSPGDPLTVPDNMVGHELYVCPAISEGWESVATAMRPFLKHIMVFISFCVIILAFVWGWALYQNLLEDKFIRDKFAKPWKMTKGLFWLCVFLFVVAVTPNKLRTVHVRGDAGDWVLCESNSPGANMVRSDAVSR